MLNNVMLNLQQLEENSTTKPIYMHRYSHRRYCLEFKHCFHHSWLGYLQRLLDRTLN